MPDDRARTLLLYLRQYGDRYSLDALRQQMAADGHAEPEIETAIRAWQAERSGSKGVWKLAVPIALLDILLTAAAIWFVLNEIGRTSGTSIGTPLAAALSIALLVEFVGGLVLILFPRQRRLALGLLFGFLLYVAVGILSAGGFCLFLIAAQR